MSKKKPAPPKKPKSARDEISRILIDIEDRSASDAEWGDEKNDAPNWRKDEKGVK